MASCATRTAHPLTPHGLTPPGARLLPIADVHALELATRPEEVARGRRWAVGEAARLGAPEDTVATVELLASEVLTNAVRYGTARGAVRMVLARIGDALRLAVSDAGDDLPQRRTPEPDALGGRGLQLLDLLTEGWGTQVYPGGGKCVWLTVPMGVASTTAVRAA